MTSSTSRLDKFERHEVIFESLRHDYHRRGDHDGQRAMEFALEQLRLVHSETRTNWVSTAERHPDKDGRVWAILTESRSNGKPGPWITGYEYYHFIDGWATDQPVRYWLDADLHPLPKIWEDK